LIHQKPKNVMLMNDRIKEGVVKGTLILFVFVAVSVRSLFAQGVLKQRSATYLGFDITFGTRSFTILSNIAEIDRMKVLEEGGAAGIVVGNKVVQAKFRQGLFNSAGCVPYTMDLLETEMNVNVNPLQMIRVRFRTVEPYVSAGMERNAIKLHGYYVRNERVGQSSGNYSQAEQPYLGQVVALRANVGLGLQYRIPCETSFLRLFTEARYGYAMSNSSTSSWFNNTRVSGQVSVNAGVCFGYLNR
jgi:hypothetical protein